MKHTLKILFTVAFLVSVFTCCILTACNTSSNEDNNIYFNNFIEIGDTEYFDGDGKYCIVYDKNTKVEYYYVTNYGHRSISISPVYNSDGSIKIYDGE